MRDYLKYAFRITFIVVAMLLLVSLVPPFEIAGVRFRRANILSDVLAFRDAAPEQAGTIDDSDRQFIEEADRLWGDDGAQSADVTVPREAVVDTVATDSVVVRQTDAFLEDNTPQGQFSVSDFGRLMEDASRRGVVRIAFFGDSFIEGDILTCDVREQLQELYGGQGAGFVSMGTPLAVSRPAVKHTFGGWKNYNLIYKKTVPVPWRDVFYASGSLSVPVGQGGAWSEFRGTGFRKGLGSWSQARLIFLSGGGATIDVTVNDSITRRFTPGASNQVQQIALTAAGMRSIRARVEGDGFVGYGVVMDGAAGVAVDNYAVRSNSGIAMFGTSQQVNARIGRMMGYDLIVLQWGLNAMDVNATAFTAYGQQLRRVINYMKTCFPGAAVIVMGVGDRATQREGRFVTAPAVGAMVREQRAAARDCGVAFWDTFAAMGGAGSMADFVSKGWAAKDYTHLSYGGGRRIAIRFVQSLLNAKGERAPLAAGLMGGGLSEAVQSVEIDLSRRAEVRDSVSVKVPVMVHDSVVERQEEAVIETKQRDKWQSLEAAVDSTRSE